MHSQGYVEASLADLKCSRIYLTLSLGLESNDFSRICSNPQVALKPTALFSLTSLLWVADCHRQPVLPIGAVAP